MPRKRKAKKSVSPTVKALVALKAMQRLTKKPKLKTRKRQTGKGLLSWLF